MNAYLIAALYKFVSLLTSSLREPLLDVCERNDVKGTLLLAHEGINGTIAGPGRYQAVLDCCVPTRVWPRWTVRVVGTAAAVLPHEGKVETRNRHHGRFQYRSETMAGEYVDSAGWNKLLDDPDVVVVDCRNDYEVAVGTFKSAINPETDSFSEFPQWVQQQSQRGACWLANGKWPCFARAAFAAKSRLSEVARF